MAIMRQKERVAPLAPVRLLPSMARNPTRIWMAKQAVSGGGGDDEAVTAV